jgi:two-component system chemotaxis response regulator CheB
VVIVQHIAPDFVPSLAGWLARLTSLDVTIAEQGDMPRPGWVYLAPGGRHLRLALDRRFELSENPTSVAHIPSGDVFLGSVARRYGARSVGVVLTGMVDGARVR